ncbi:MAG: DNA polymerase III subunit beta [Anaerolineae bacterium]
MKVNNGQFKNQQEEMEMKAMFTVSAAELKKSLATMKKGMDRKSSLPILNSLHIVLEEQGCFYIERTNLQVFVRRYFGGGTWDNAFDVVVEDAALFEKTVGSFGKAEINGWIEEEEFEGRENDNSTRKVKKYRKTLVLSNGKNEVRFNCLYDGLKDFPSFPNNPSCSFDKADLAQLRDAVALTVPFAAEDETRPILHAVNFKFHDNSLSLAATDGFRLGWYKKVEIEKGEANGVPLDYSINIPLNAARLLAEALKDTEEVSFLYDKAHNWMFFHTDHYRLVCTLTDGNYPDYNTIIPKHSNTSVNVAAVEMLQVVKAVEPLVKDNYGITVFDLENNGTAEEDKFEIKPKLGNGSKWNVEGDVVGQNLQIAFNATYLKDAFSAFGKRNVEMKFGSAASPMLINVNDNAVHVLMPMHVAR